MGGNGIRDSGLLPGRRITNNLRRDAYLGASGLPLEFAGRSYDRPGPDII